MKKRPKLERNLIEVYTDANPEIACIAIERIEDSTDNERKFDLIVIKNKCDNLFEAEAVRIALNYLPENSHAILYCDKEGDINAIKNGKASKKELQTIIDDIKILEKRRRLTIDYEYTPRRKNLSGRFLEKYARVVRAI